jgi:UDP-glucose 6-dehydrogenase
MASNEQQARTKEESLQDNIREARNNNLIKRKELKDAQSEVYEAKRSEQSAKMLADASRYEQLRLAKEEEKREFEKALVKCRQEHESIVNMEREQHRKEMEFRNTQIAELMKDIDRTRKRNEATLESI